MLGAYFGTTRINEGAAGLGGDHLTAYADGVVGGNAPDATPGSLMSFRDGVLGLSGDELHAYADGVVGGSVEDPAMPGPLYAYHDGSLGDDGRPSGLVENDQEISVWHNGVLGAPESSGTEFRSLQAYKDGVLGEYFAGIGAASGNVLDLGNAGVLGELKTALALLAPEQTLTAEGQAVYTPDFYTSGIWEPSASALWQYIVGRLPGASGKTVSQSAKDQLFPNPTGVGLIVATLAAPQSSTYGPEYVKKNLPALFAWYQAGGGTVLAPYLSISDKTKDERAGTGTMSATTMAAYGLGAVVLFGIFILSGKKRRAA